MFGWTLNKQHVDAGDLLKVAGFAGNQQFLDELRILWTDSPWTM